MIVGQRGPLEPEIGRSSRATRSSGSTDASTSSARMSQPELFDEYRRASRLLPAVPCRRLGDRDGIPNVMVEAMACGLPVVSTGVSGHPRARRHGVNGLLVAAGGSRRPSPTRSLRLYAIATLAAGSGREAQATVRARFDGDRLAGRARRALPGGGGMRAAARLPVSARPRSGAAPVYCVIEHEHGDRAVAEAVRAGRFDVLRADARARHGARLARRPTLPADEEWRIAWSKFYDGLDLAHAFAASRRRALPRAPGSDSCLLDRAGARRLGLRATSPRAASRTGSTRGSGSPASPASPGSRRGSTSEIVAQHRRAGRIHPRPIWRRRATTGRSSSTRSSSSRSRCRSSIPAASCSRDAIAGLHENLLTDVRPDGVHCECSTHYHLLVLRSFLGARENARRFGLRFPDGFDERLERACEFALHCHRPDGPIPALSDADTGCYGELLELAADAARPARTSSTRRRRARAGRRPGGATSSFPSAATSSSAAVGATNEPVRRRALPRLRLRPARRRRATATTTC